MIIYRHALQSDLLAVTQLLDSSALPASDCAEHIEHFIVALEDGELIAVGGLEHLGELALLRSFAVNSKVRGRGLAEVIFHKIKAKAIESGVQQLYLLTTSATDYFARFGFKPGSRECLPELIKSTKQFSQLCPGTAQVMSLNLLEN